MANKAVNKVRDFFDKYVVARPKPFVPRAGVGKPRYGNGGKVSRKNNV